MPLYAATTLLNVRLARPDKAAVFKQAVGASQSTDDLMLVYLVEWMGRTISKHKVTFPASLREPMQRKY
jgi:hypothetical protein